MSYDVKVAVDEAGLVAYHEEGREPQYLGLDIGSNRMLLWSEQTQTFAISASALMGVIRFMVEELPSEPLFLAAPEWEVVEETSATFTSNRFELMDWEMAQPDIPSISFTKNACHRLRMYGTGRNHPVEFQSPSDSDINERYLLQVWPEKSMRSDLPIRSL